jgi:methionyl-tRNA formyltransferase
VRFAITAADRYLGVFEAFVQAGWTPLKLFTVAADTGVDSCRAVAAYADRCHASVQYHRLQPGDLRELEQQECDALVVASYPWRIAGWEPFLKYAINFHASPLPEARGPYPLHRAILENRSRWGVTCHQITPEFDRGDILGAEDFPMDPGECHESLNIKIQMAAKTLAGRIARDLPGLWRQARPQGEGSYWPLVTIEERIIHFEQPVATILRHVRAFGRAESLAAAGNSWLVVTRASGWEEPHRHKPGQIVHINGRTIIITARDGYIALLEAGLADPIVGQALAARGIVCQATPPLSAAPIHENAAQECL